MKLSPARRKALQQAADKFHASLDDQTWGYLLARGLSEEQVRARLLGLVSVDCDPMYADLVGRLCIPYLTPTGVVALRFRCLEDHDCKEYEEQHGFHKKYHQMAKAPDHLYNVLALHERHPALGITEGEFDAMVVDEHVLPTVGVPGATKWKPYWARLMEDHERVFLIGDGDDAGKRFVEKLMGELPNGHPVVFPPGHDPNSFFLEYGPEGLTEFIVGHDAT